VSFDELMRKIVRIPEQGWVKSYLIVWFMCEAIVYTLSSEEAISFLHGLRDRLGNCDSDCTQYVDYTLARAYQTLGEHRNALQAYKRSYLASARESPSIINRILTSSMLVL